MAEERKTVKVDGMRPESRQEVTKLLDEGWEIVDVKDANQESCHDPSVGSNETVYYELRKK